MMNLRDFAKKNKFLVLIIIFLIVEVYLGLTRSSITWDESVYMGMAKYLRSFGKIGLWEDLRPVIIPLILAIIHLLNLPMIVAGKIMFILISAGVVMLVFLIAKKIADTKHAYIASILLISSQIFMLYSNYILTDMLGIFFILTSIYFLIKQNYFATGLFVSLAFVTRFIYIIAFPIIIAAALVEIKYSKGLYKNVKVTKDFIKLSASVAIVILPFLIFNSLNYYNISSSLLKSALHPVLLAKEHQNNTLFSDTQNPVGYFMAMLTNPFYIFGIVGVIALLLKSIFRNEWLKERHAILLAVLALAYLIYLLIIPNKQYRFLLSAIPLFAIYSAYSMSKLFFMIGFKCKKKTMEKIVRVAIAIVILISCIIVVLNAIFIDYSQKRQAMFTNEKEIYSYFDGKDGIILTQDPRFAAYSNALFYPMYGTFYSEYNTMDSIVKSIVNNTQISYFVLVPENYYDYLVLKDNTSLDYFNHLLQDNEIKLVTKMQGKNEQYWIYESSHFKPKSQF